MHTIALALKGVNKIYAFEPNIYTYTLLVKNILNNNLKNVIPINKGLSISPQNLNVKFKSKNFFDNNCGAFTIGDQEEGELITNIDITTIDTLNLDRLDLIKLDTEGYEERTIKGGLETIKKYKPIIILEDWSTQVINGKICPDVNIEKTKLKFQFLLDIGYEINYISYKSGSPDFIFSPI